LLIRQSRFYHPHKHACNYLISSIYKCIKQR